MVLFCKKSQLDLLGSAVNGETLRLKIMVV